MVKRIVTYEGERVKQSRWLTNALNERQITVSELARRMHVTRQMVYNLLHGHQRMTFLHVIAICYLLKLEDDPKEIYKQINEN